jgi:dihydrofolate reductase
MGRIVVTEYISIDGVIEAPGGVEDYEHVNWALEYERGEEGQKFKADETFGSEALLLGRITYEGFARAWPTMTGEFADKFNAMPKYVISKTLVDPEWNNTTVLRGDVIEEADALKRAVDGDIVVHGSAQLARALFAAGLVDELHLMVFPLILGSGKRLFDSNGKRRHMPLREARTVGEGITILVYGPISVAASPTSGQG